VTPIDPLAIAALVASVLEEQGIRYVIGGSVASSLIGEPRTTLDLDVMIDAGEDEVRRLAAALEGRFYIDADDAVESVRRMSSFNAIHLDSSMKVDFFPAEPLGREQIERRQRIVVRPELPALYFYSAEDLIIRKLLWFRAGGEASDRQWRDVVSIMKSSRLDFERLFESARGEGLRELLLRAARDSGVALSNHGS
jgi:hypothetical protein